MNCYNNTQRKSAWTTLISNVEDRIWSQSRIAEQISFALFCSCQIAVVLINILFGKFPRRNIYLSSQNKNGMDATIRGSQMIAFPSLMMQNWQHLDRNVKCPKAIWISKTLMCSSDFPAKGFVTGGEPASWALRSIKLEASAVSTLFSFNM